VSDEPSTVDWEAAIEALLDARPPGSSACPSEVARAAAGPAWRGRMPDVRAAARSLARRGRVVLTQRGRVLDPEAEPRGPIRLSRPGGRPS
jgi:hypothetical protein